MPSSAFVSSSSIGSAERSKVFPSSSTPKRYLHQPAIARGMAVNFFASPYCATGVDVVPASFFSALAIAFMAHLFARIFKAPVTVFLIAGILPTVPGAGMYRIAYSIVANDRAGCAYYLLQTLEIAGMIALAIFIVDAIFRVHIPLSRRNS